MARLKKILLGPRLKYFWLPISIAGWTILQSVAHAWWVSYGREMLACEVKVKRKVEFYLYMTYLYSVNKCDCNALDEFGTIQFNKSEESTIRKRNVFGLQDMYKEDGTMTDSLMHLYLASDAFWIVTSVSLFIGILLRLKQCSALIFYLPWILVALAILAVDLFSSLYYGLQLPTAEIIQTPLPWKLEKSTIMAIISGRLGFIWILNIFNLVYICWFTRVSYHQRYSDERMRRTTRGHKIRDQVTEERIKRWQIYYGTVEEDHNHTTTTFKLDEDLNYTSTFKELEEYNQRKKSHGSSPEYELCSTFKSSSTIDETNHNFNTSAPINQEQHSCNESKSVPKKKVQITELVSHLPWTYIDNNKELFSYQEQLHHAQNPDNAMITQIQTQTHDAQISKF